jgi:hypothetical protein
MSPRIDFYFDLLSPYSYLASTVLPRLAAEHSAPVRYRPFSLVELMQRVGNRPTTLECRNKFAYAIADLRRWARSYGVAFAPTPYFESIDFALLDRGALVAIDEGRGADYVEAVYAAKGRSWSRYWTGPAGTAPACWRAPDPRTMPASWRRTSPRRPNVASSARPRSSSATRCSSATTASASSPTPCARRPEATTPGRRPQRG